MMENVLTLEVVSSAQLTREAVRKKERAEIARRLACPLNGSGRVEVQPIFNLGQTGQIDLFNPIQNTAENKKGAQK